jgi:four helix bundle protein
MKSNVSSHEDLRIWLQSRELIKDIYIMTSQFPKDELYALTNQMRRASISVTSNIAEGAARRTPKEFVRFLYISSGSLSELETQILISVDLGYKKETEIKDLLKIIVSLRGQIHSTIRSLQQRI